MEKIHAELYKKALDNLDKLQDNIKYYVCPVCGYTAEKEEDRCPICGIPWGKFIVIE